MKEQAVTVSKPFREAAPIPPWKRALDLSCIVLTSPIWLLVMAPIALIIKLVSRGPILFRQERIGYLGRPFICFKFRTMHPDAAQGVHKEHLKELMQSEGPMKKLDPEDGRLIRFGSLWRATGLDELPQIFNVLRGEMSLVGPRPCLDYEYEKYLPWQKRRVNTLPGITGLWQVSGKNQTSFVEMIQLDISYLTQRSLRLDVAIMLKTP